MKYRSKKHLLTAVELRLIEQLRHIAAAEFHVIPKLDLSTIIEPDINQWERNSGWEGCVDKIRQKRPDFVLLDKEWRPFCAIALINYDKSILLDLEMQAMLSSAGIPLLALEKNKQYSIEQLVAKITEICT